MNPSRKPPHIASQQVCADSRSSAHSVFSSFRFLNRVNETAAAIIHSTKTTNLRQTERVILMTHLLQLYFTELHKILWHLVNQRLNVWFSESL